MEITGGSNLISPASVSILKKANEQAQLAGDLITKTVENLKQIQTTQIPSQNLDISGLTETGGIINTTA